MQVVRAVGGRAPLHLTSVGKLFLAVDDPRSVRQYASRTGLTGHTRNSITDLVRLEAELERVRERGFARDNEELEPGVRCIAAGIRDDSGRLVAGLSVSAPADFVKEEWITDCKKTKNKALCEVIEDYFDFIKRDNKKEKAKRFFASVGKITKKNIQKMQSGSFQGLLHALPSKNKNLLIEFAREAIKTPACPQNLSLALAYNLEPFAGNPNYFPLIEKLYSRGLACAKPSEQAYELGNLRFALIYTALRARTG
jgi:hypothetical protein